jgi:hypothetical protein
MLQGRCRPPPPIYPSFVLIFLPHTTTTTTYFYPEREADRKKGVLLRERHCCAYTSSSVFANCGHHLRVLLVLSRLCRDGSLTNLFTSDNTLANCCVYDMHILVCGMLLPLKLPLGKVFKPRKMFCYQWPPPASTTPCRPWPHELSDFRAVLEAWLAFSRLQQIALNSAINELCQGSLSAGELATARSIVWDIVAKTEHLQVVPGSPKARTPHTLVVRRHGRRDRLVWMIILSEFLRQAQRRAGWSGG